MAIWGSRVSFPSVVPMAGAYCVCGSWQCQNRQDPRQMGSPKCFNKACCKKEETFVTVVHTTVNYRSFNSNVPRSPLWLICHVSYFILANLNISCAVSNEWLTLTESNLPARPKSRHVLCCNPWERDNSRWRWVIPKCDEVLGRYQFVLQ